MTTTRTAEQDTRHWAWPWLMGGSLGLSAVGLGYLANYFWAWPWGWEPAAALWLTMFGVYPFVYHLPDVGAAVGGMAGAFMRGLLARDDDRREDVTDEPAAPTVTPLVGGGYLTERESYHREGLRLLLEHARAAGSLTSIALIPAAFADSKHWGYWTDLAAHNGLCEKQNGVTTVLPDGHNYVWALRRVYAWTECEVPEDDTAPLPLPYPFSEGLAYKHKAEKALQGPLKRDEDD